MEASHEAVLLEQARAGDPAAFQALVEAAAPSLEAALRSLAGSRLRSVVDLDELRQETVSQALSSLARFEWRGPGSFAGWLCGVARFVVLGTLRRQRQLQPLEIVEGLPAADPSPSRAVRREERFSRLESAFAGLSEEHREVLRLARLEGLTSQMIAERTGRSPEAVRQLLSRALRALRRSFGDTESFSLPDRRLDPPQDSEKGRPDARP